MAPLAVHNLNFQERLQHFPRIRENHPATPPLERKSPSTTPKYNGVVQDIDHKYLLPADWQSVSVGKVVRVRWGRSKRLWRAIAVDLLEDEDEEEEEQEAEQEEQEEKQEQEQEVCLSARSGLSSQTHHGPSLPFSGPSSPFPGPFPGTSPSSLGSPTSIDERLVTDILSAGDMAYIYQLSTFMDPVEQGRWNSVSPQTPLHHFPSHSPSPSPVTPPTQTSPLTHFPSTHRPRRFQLVPMPPPPGYVCHPKPGSHHPPRCHHPRLPGSKMWDISWPSSDEYCHLSVC